MLAFTSLVAAYPELRSNIPGHPNVTSPVPYVNMFGVPASLTNVPPFTRIVNSVPTTLYAEYDDDQTTATEFNCDCHNYPPAWTSAPMPKQLEDRYLASTHAIPSTRCNSLMLG
jgi:hypothetical protein